MNTIEIPTAEAKEHLSDYLAKSSHGETRVIVTRRGRPVAAIVSIDDLHELEQIEQRSGLSAIAGKWKGIEDIAEDVLNSRNESGGGRNVSL